ncbi:MAG: class IV adenylate cyclase [Lachnospiraceae bacterium]|nr:class IV adenylate cyclase [Lachnospiraceae bacterium]
MICEISHLKLYFQARYECYNKRYILEKGNKKLAIEVEIKLKIRDRQALAAKLTELGFRPGRLLRETDVYFCAKHHDFAERDEALRVRETEDLETGEKTAQLNFKGPKLDDASMTRREMETNIGDGGTVRAILEQIGFTPVIPVEKVRNYFHRGRLTACVDQVTGLGEFLELEILTESEEGRSAALTEIEEVLRQIGHSMEDTTRISYLSQLCSKLENEI